MKKAAPKYSIGSKLKRRCSSEIVRIVDIKRNCQDGWSYIMESNKHNTLLRYSTSLIDNKPDSEFVYLE